MNRRAGFTLVELMIAMIAGAFAVAGIYYLNGVTARAFSQQMAVSDMQMSLRSAMEQVRRDFARAGYLGTPDSRVSRDCQGALNGTGTDVSPRQIQALRIGFNGSLAYTGPTPGASGAQVTALVGSNPVRSDDITLFGNYATADSYLADPTLSSSQIIYLQPNSEAFRRSFMTPGATSTDPATQNTAAFQTAFARGHMVRIEVGGRVYFRDISRNVTPPANWATVNQPYIVLEQALPPCAEITGFMAVSPIVRLHYGLESDQGTEFSRLAGSAAIPGARRAMLVRREEDAFVAASTPVVGTARVVLDYAAEFGIDAIMNSQLDNTVRPTWAYSMHADVATQSTNAPERFRSLVVTLATRSIEADPRLPAPATRTIGANNTLNPPLMLFRVFDSAAAGTAMYARVRTMRSEIFLQNL